MSEVQAPASEAAAAVSASPLARQNPMLKLLLELGPVVLFIATNATLGIYYATAVLMVSVVVTLIASYVMTKRLPIMPIVTAVAVLVFGGLTLFLHDKTFIKIKPTIVNAIFGTALLGGLAFGKSLLPIVLDTVLQIDEAGWKKLTLRWGLFFYALAIANEIVWRTQTDTVWGYFKGANIPVTIVFALAQVPLILRHELKPAPGPAEGT